VAARLSSIPSFGQADLSNCEREQIQLAGSIQPHGALLVVHEPDCQVVQSSANAATFLGVVGGVVGQSLQSLEGDLWERIAPHLDEALDELPIAVRCHIGEPAAQFDCLLHRPPTGGLVIELERAGPAVDLTRHLESSLRTIVTSSSVRALSDEAARMFKELTGYDRVMVYRFDDDGHGEVLSEERRPELEPYLGNRYPSSDIPQIARRLYERNRVRVLADVEYVSVPLAPRLSPLTGEDLDMSLCFLRSMSPIHVQYLKNMGVAATLVVSLMVGGRLWGLVACHHYEPRFVHFEIRSVCELLAEAIGTRIAALQSFAQAQAELSVRRLEQRMIEVISRDGDWRSALFDSQQSLLKPLNATGAALLFEDQILVAGDVPGTQQLREIGKWLDCKPRAAVMATASLGIDEPTFSSLTPVASGLLATPVSNSPGDYLFWFRPERIRTITWAGNPFKAVVIGDNPADLSPRRSFAQWHQIVEGTSEPWTPADLTTGRLIGDTMTDVILQFRSVRMLIAQDQLKLVHTQVKQAEQPLIMADAEGRIILVNRGFEALIPESTGPLETLDALPALFSKPTEIRRRLRDLTRERRTWRAEVSLKLVHSVRPLLVRADPVFSAPGRVLGFVLLFMDISERKAVDAARRRLQDGIIRGNRAVTARLDARASLLYQDLLSSVVENAQLAALEITDGSDTALMAEMLESIRSSVTRTADLLEHLLWHASKVDR
jgi:light-regulated signal transduction histidine kinase (bacteriophytochrome)